MAEKRDSITAAGILVVESDEPEAHRMANFLQRLDATVTFATAFDQAVSDARADEFALILVALDSLGRARTFEACQSIAKIPLNRQTPMIFIGADDTQEVIEIESYVSGGIDFLRKPVNEYILIRKVNVLLQLYRAKVMERNISAALSTLTTGLRQSNEDLSEFAHVASHDLKSPLSLIIGFGELLEEKFAPEFPEDAQDYLRRIVAAGRRMGTLINDLLDYAQAENTESSRSKVELQPILESVAADFQHKNASITIGELPQVWGDQRDLRQLFANIVGNGVKYHREGVDPIVKVTTEDLEGDLVCINVEDNGIGIDKAAIGKIFNPFQRLVGRNQYEGSGIGLAIVKKIIDRQGGRIGVSSEPGRGTTFHIHLRTEPA